MKYLLGRVWTSLQSAAGEILVYLSQRVGNTGKGRSGKGRGNGTKRIRKSRGTERRVDLEDDDSSCEGEENPLDQGFYEDSDESYMEERNRGSSQPILPSNINDRPASEVQRRNYRQPDFKYRKSQKGGQRSKGRRQLSASCFFSSDESLVDFVLDQGQYQRKTEGLEQRMDEEKEEIGKVETQDPSLVLEVSSQMATRCPTSNLSSFIKSSNYHKSRICSGQITESPSLVCPDSEANNGVSPTNPSLQNSHKQSESAPSSLCLES